MTKQVRLMPISQVMDFYYAEAIASETKQARNWRAGEKLVEDATILRDRLADYLAPALYNYLIVACYGEAEHSAYAAAGLYFKQSGNYRRALSFKPESMIETLRCIFETQQWEGGFGGKKWAHICEELTKVGTMPKVAWVDHLIDLEHNGGSAFDKEEEAHAANVDINTYMDPFLEFKAKKDILIDRPPALWLPLCREIVSLIERYYTVYTDSNMPTWFGAARDVWGNRYDRGIVPYHQPRIGTKEVTIGDLIVPKHVRVNEKGKLVEVSPWNDDY